MQNVLLFLHLSRIQVEEIAVSEINLFKLFQEQAWPSLQDIEFVSVEVNWVKGCRTLIIRDVQKEQS